MTHLHSYLRHRCPQHGYIATLLVLVILAFAGCSAPKDMASSSADAGGERGSQGERGEQPNEQESPEEQGSTLPEPQVAGESPAVPTIDSGHNGLPSDLPTRMSGKVGSKRLKQGSGYSSRVAKSQSQSRRTEAGRSYQVSPQSAELAMELTPEATSETAAPTPLESAAEGHAAGANTEKKIGIDDIDFAQSVDVYFATDRRPTSEVLPSMWRTFVPAAAVGCLSWAMFVGLTFAKRLQTMWLLGSGLATFLGVLVLHVCIVRWQEYSRLANGNSTRFSVLRYEPEPGAYPLHLGVARVSIPDSHEKGKMEKPSVFRLEFAESPDKHIMLQSVEVHDSPDDWFAGVSDQVRFATEREGFLFIHGYNVKFGAAVQRTAQLAYDLNVVGPVMSYSWPSRGQLAGYAADESSVSWSSPKLEKLLVDLVAHTEIRQINIVAHSMGNRALMESIERLQLRGGGVAGRRQGPKMLGTVIMAAPDVDAQIFESRYANALQSVADHATIYFTDDDLALQVSRRLHVSPRLGLGALPNGAGVEAVHTGDQGIFSLGHSYYGSDPVVIDDMKQVLNSRKRAADRAYLRETVAENGSTFYEIDRVRYASLQASTVTR
ncbi:MAG: alpha/beta hydrolase [Pirellulaceae bacterium]